MSRDHPVQVPRYLFDDKSMTAQAKWLLIVLLYLADEQGTVEITNEELAEKLGITVRGMQKQLAELKTTPYIETERIQDGFITRRVIYVRV